MPSNLKMMNHPTTTARHLVVAVCFASFYSVPSFAQLGAISASQSDAIAAALQKRIAANQDQLDKRQPKAVVDQGEAVAPTPDLTAPKAPSDVFGANLFNGSFGKKSTTQFNPDYVISVGDEIQVKLWGAFSFSESLSVDPKGNIFIPHTGPVNVLGVKNRDLQAIVQAAVNRTYKNNVYVYASLSDAQPVRIFVGGNVVAPGMYEGTSMDSLLHYIDRAGGIDPERGSYLKVIVKRSGIERANANLYDFLLSGTVPGCQLHDGDVIFVGPRGATVKVSGLASNPYRFELSSESISLRKLVDLAKPLASATNVRVTRNTGSVQNVEYYALSESSPVTIMDGDEVEFTADKKPGTITVRVEGEHEGAQEYVLPYGAKMADVLPKVKYTERSDRQNIQLYRKSVKDRQRDTLQVALQSLENAALTARSGTSDEARLRADEADLLLKWVERAKKIEPKGQVVVSQGTDQPDLLLENGDVLKIPVKDNLVLVAGEVMFPNAIVFDSAFSVEDYIKKTGGYSQNAGAAKIVVAHRDGSYEETLDTSDKPIKPGDEIYVLPKIDVKSRQIWKDMMQVIYQIAISAKIALGI